MASRTPDLPVTYGDTVRGGRAPNRWTGRWIIVGDESFVEIGEALYASCGACDRGVSGSKAAFSGILGGVCFQCGGSGLRGKGMTLAQVQTLAKRRRTDRARRDRKAADKAAAAKTAAEAWRAEHPALAAGLAEVKAAILAEQDTHGMGIAGQHVNGALYEFAFKADRDALTPKQTAFAESLLAEHREEQAAEAHRAATQRYAGEVGEKVAVTGTVVVRRYIAPRQYGWSGSHLLIVEGTGADEGVTVKTFSAAGAVGALEPGQAVTITGTVKAHDTYDGTPQTVLARPKAAPQG